jgi:hypothetical protein
MKNLLLVFLVALSAALSSCSVTSGTRKPDGTLAIYNQRFLWSSEGIKTSVKDSNNATNGLEFTLEVQKSNPDAAAIHEVFSGVGSIMGQAARTAATGGAAPALPITLPGQ